MTTAVAMVTPDEDAALRVPDFVKFYPAPCRFIFELILDARAPQITLCWEIIRSHLALLDLCELWKKVSHWFAQIPAVI
jgi:hypothetical protein